MKYGYARVRSSVQDLTIQVEAFKAAGCEPIRQEKVSGTCVQGKDPESAGNRVFQKIISEYSNEGTYTVSSGIA